MTDYDPNDLSGTENLVKLPQANDSNEATAKAEKTKKVTTPKPATKKKTSTKPTTKRSTEITQPQNIDDAIAAGMKPSDLDALVKLWGQYNLQEAVRQATAATDAMASSVQARRRQIADKLLKYAEGFGISMTEARKIFEEERCAEKSGKLK